MEMHKLMKSLHWTLATSGYFTTCYTCWIYSVFLKFGLCFITCKQITSDCIRFVCTLTSSIMDEVQYQAMCVFLESNPEKRNWPSTVSVKDHKRNYRKKADKYAMVDGVLHSRHSKHGLLRVIKQGEKDTILTALHGALGDGGHLGIDKTRKKAACRYFWSGMNDDIKEYIGKNIIYYI